MQNKYLVPFILVTSLFFLWAFLHNINPILIPHLRKACQLSDTQSSYIDTAVYLAYFTIAIPAGLVMQKFGYKNGILIGLVLYMVGAFLFIPAANSRSFELFLFALFVSASGATFLETVANPYISLLGDPESSEQRLNFAQSFNGVGAFVAPILGGLFILSGVEYSTEQLSNMAAPELQSYLQSEANTVKVPYLVIGCVVLLMIAIFAYKKLPEFKAADEVSKPFSWQLLRHKRLAFAIIAQFFYVGAQVGVGSFFIRFAKFTADVPEKSAAYFWGSIAMVGFMVGRFVGTWLMTYVRPGKLLAIYAAVNVVLLAAAISSSGNTAIYALMSVPFFMSIMFPTIFSAGIKGLGEDTKIASSLIVMSIIGGAFAPLAMGYLSDTYHSIQVAYVVPMLCFVIVLLFGMTISKTEKLA